MLSIIYFLTKQVNSFRELIFKHVFIVDYNFMVNCLSKFVGEDRIYGDFVLQENASDDVVRNGLFLVVSILEKYHDVVRANNKRIDLSRYKNKCSIDIE